MTSGVLPLNFCYFFPPQPTSIVPTTWSQTQTSCQRSTDASKALSRLFCASLTVVPEWQKLNRAEWLRTQQNSCDSTEFMCSLLKEQPKAYNQSAASTGGQIDGHYGSRQQQRSQPATQFPAYFLGSGARVYPCEADVNI